jgi:GNAT superfamily N-acetyltransferase
MMLRFSTFVGRDTIPLLPELARLCTVVFREWPHLYDGDGLYDQAHLRALAESPRSALIIAYDGDVAVGASTCLPLEDATEDVRAPFQERGWKLSRWFYFAESVLLPAYRGRGASKVFLSTKEQHVRTVSCCDRICFCTMLGSESYPSSHAGTNPLDAFWRRQGYKPCPGLRCTMSWRKIGESADSDISLLFWVKQAPNVT